MTSKTKFNDRRKGDNQKRKERNLRKALAALVYIIWRPALVDRWLPPSVSKELNQLEGSQGCQAGNRQKSS